MAKAKEAELGSNRDSTPIKRESSSTSALRWILAVLLAASLTSVLHKADFLARLRHYCASGPVMNLPNQYILCSAEGETSVYTVGEANAVKQCVGVDSGFVVSTGDLRTVQHGRNWRVYRIPPGAMVVPGLSDSHCHILEHGAARQIPFGDATSVEESVEMVASYILANPDVERNRSEAIVSWGWDHESWSAPKYPTAADLELNPISRGRRVILQSKDGHAIWVSKAILDAYAPYPDTVEGGVIMRDSSGSPTGVFFDAAQNLIEMPSISDEELSRRLHMAARDALALGLTSLHDAGFKPESMEAFKREVEAHGKLPVRVYAMTHFDEYASYWTNGTEMLHGMGDKERFSARSLKIFADGALRTSGAALYEPYSDDPGNRGQMRLSGEALQSVVRRFAKAGWQVNVHAIGDRANGLVLDAFESVLREDNKVDARETRPRLEHAQVMAEADFERIGRLGVIASVQPTHVISDMPFAKERLGTKRVKGLYAFRSILSSGARITLGTDFPVESMDPMKTFYAAVTRRAFNVPEGEGWYPEQRLTRTEALRGLTIDPAYASFTESVLGSLESGKRADWVILSKDIMKVDMNEVLTTKVLATALDGEIVFGGL
ncbi:amidohydrolase family-domain-containing protein [Ephemerocybe angulata]|uniref:Amidohydrolase family-domain-containing protein n=1 Tax=Ephemerocybe angulata TaxID=980116 RepID=A0A8H6MGZ5_9AGAR|nr:amidohydrolase family-domain-containing protein [Tulosesus angulatus]